MKCSSPLNDPRAYKAYKMVPGIRHFIGGGSFRGENVAFLMVSISRCHVKNRETTHLPRSRNGGHASNLEMIFMVK